MKILILYFSGVGATRKIAEMMAENLSSHEIEIFSVENMILKDFSCYNALIVGTPTHHAEPARYLMDYIENLPTQSKIIPTFIFNTKGLASCHTNRMLAKSLFEKNLITIYEADYIAPASDGSLLVPSFNRFFRFEKNVELKVAQDCLNFIQLTESQMIDDRIALPRWRFSSVINAPNKFGSNFVTIKIHLHKDACIKCNLCIKGCPHNAFTTCDDGYPIVIKDKCVNCYRCIHHCPKRALSLFRKKKHMKVLGYE